MRIPAQRPVSVVAVVMRGDETLIVKRVSGYLAPVSGRVEDSEDEAATLVREVFEEVALKVRPVRHVWTCQTENGVYDLHWWLADYVSGDITLKLDEVSSAMWIKPSDFTNLENTFADDRKFYAEIFPNLSEA
jgi:8-oxo-dGTP diphosphatase